MKTWLPKVPIDVEHKWRCNQLTTWVWYADAVLIFWSETCRYQRYLEPNISGCSVQTVQSWKHNDWSNLYINNLPSIKWTSDTSSWYKTELEYQTWYGKPIWKMNHIHIISWFMHINWTQIVQWSKLQSAENLNSTKEFQLIVMPHHNLISRSEHQRKWNGR